jgi:hypothetical protein
MMAAMFRRISSAAVGPDVSVRLGRCPFAETHRDTRTDSGLDALVQGAIVNLLARLPREWT